MGKFKDVARLVYAPIMNKAFDIFYGPKRYKYLYRTIREVKAKNIMEVGTFHGSRAKSMIETAKLYSDPKTVAYYGFDLFEEMTNELYFDELSKRSKTRQEIESMLAETGVDIHLFKGNTMQSLPENVSKLPNMDFIYIDGGHSLETVENDWKYSEMLMHDRTVVIFDDYWPNRPQDGGSKQLIDALDRSKYSVEVLPILDSFDNPDLGKLDIQFAKVTRNLTSK